MTPLENTSALASIGLQAIEAQKARKVWIEAKARNVALLRTWSSENGESYIGEPHGEPDQDIDEAFYDRRMAAKESVKQARKLRSMIGRYLAKEAA